ncbi:MAG: hypothetical protein FJZ47_23990 [Candidatus Tectomicrobia bacterium]|uniref:Uncharacterized protein n=1 Tax=Tectimicrobiota bacterium TaxID=2528274 RepID=A0A937W622_UNCTE|nr:hypothetical protein [Candidatus Tectomicrobia bacterium]
MASLPLPHANTIRASMALAQLAGTTRTTTLYDLVATVQDSVGPEQDNLVVATVMSFLRTHRATWSSAEIDPDLLPQRLTRAS